MTRSVRTFINRALVVAALLSVTVLLSGCSRTDKRSAAEIKADLVASMLKGVKQPGLDITVSAESYDTDAQELHGVRVHGKQGVLYAERATISVDEKTKAIRMKLFDVIVAQPADGSDPKPAGTQGQIVEYREMVLDDLFAPHER